MPQCPNAPINAPRCFFFAGVWIMGSNGVAKTLSVSEESALLDVLLALALSAYAFFLIFVLDKLADADFTGPDADAFIYTFMGGLGILIGFAWEQVPPTPNPTLTLPTHH